LRHQLFGCPLLVMRGTFGHPELLDPGLFLPATDQLAAEGVPFEQAPTTLLEMGALLEGLGRLLVTNVKRYVEPMPRSAFITALRDAPAIIPVRQTGDGFVTLDDLIPSSPSRQLLEYLRASGQIVSLEHLH
jgi:hypothetical protein